MIHDLHFIETYLGITVIVFAILTYIAVMQGRAKLLHMVLLPLFALNMGIVHDLKQGSILLSILLPLICYTFFAILYYFNKD